MSGPTPSPRGVPVRVLSMTAIGCVTALTLLPAPNAAATTPGQATTGVTSVTTPPGRSAMFVGGRARRSGARLLVPVTLVDSRTGGPVTGALITAVAVPDHGPQRPLSPRRTDHSGRTTLALPGRFHGTVLLGWHGDRAHRPVSATLKVTPAAPVTSPVAPPTSVTFGHAVSCVFTPDHTDMTIVYTVVFHGGRYTDLGNYGDQTVSQVAGGDHEIKLVSLPGGFAGNGVIPAGAPTTFEPSYSEALTTFGAPDDFSHSRAFEGILPPEQVTCR